MRPENLLRVVFLIVIIIGALTSAIAMRVWRLDRQAPHIQFNCPSSDNEIPMAPGPHHVSF